MWTTSINTGREIKLGSFETPWTKAEKLGISAGRKAGSEAVLEQALRANGLKPDTEGWDQAMRTGREAMKITQEHARQKDGLFYQGPDGSWVRDTDYDAAVSRDWDAADGL